MVINVVNAEVVELLDVVVNVVVVSNVTDVDVVVLDNDCDPPRLLYILRRRDPPQYSRGLPKHDIVHPDAVSALPALTVFPQ